MPFYEAAEKTINMVSIRRSIPFGILVIGATIMGIIYSEMKWHIPFVNFILSIPYVYPAIKSLVIKHKYGFKMWEKYIYPRLFWITIAGSIVLFWSVIGILKLALKYV